ncbi:hypothetical protein PLESTB_001236700 [Pleodorina starrii]|uniref:Ankyrin repeat domain-containing protein n=1 Tax=Pleodorina starrii TaxID=330485 RepID=A0A9W6F5Y8_9CHLO|nr:hypothetical protein PLESTM_000223000 [Pleodorina starrii]GLC57524.1 hypothetical protein PLESTB_001236700 [Pleodorina starrii]
MEIPGEEAFTTASRVWWTPGLLERIVSFLPPNDIACSIRLINRATAALFREPQYTTIHLSQPCAPLDFARRWGSAGAVQQLTCKQRRQVVSLTAVSGVIANLKVAFKAAGCLPTGEMMEAAAAAGQLQSCEWLRERGCRWGYGLSAAARAGCWVMCGWLLVSGCHWDIRAVYSAAHGGHLGLMDWLLHCQPACMVPELQWSGLFVAVAEGCDLPTLQALHHHWSQGHVRSGSGQQQQVAATLEPSQHSAVVAAAATSSTPDWRAKVQWLEELLAWPRGADVAAKALTHPDGLDRLQWLRARGYPLRLGDVADGIVDMAAPPVVSAALLDYLVSEDEGAASNLEPALKLAADCGHLALLRAWHSAGRLAARPHFLSEMAHAAARGGRLPVLTWLSEEVGLSLGVDSLFYCAARNGDVPMMAWVVDHSGCVASVQDAVRGGCEAALDWTLSRGGGGGLSVDNLVDAYVDAASFGDVASLRWLTRRLPLPHGWSSRQRIQASFQRGIPLPGLLWLAEVVGTPLDGREVADTVLRSPTCAYLREPKAAYWAHVVDQIGYWRAATGSKLVGAEEMAAVLAEGIS